MAKQQWPQVGDEVRFKGYADNVPDGERFLEEGELYTVIEVNAKDESVAFEIDNPDFNPKKKETDENSKVLVVDVFFDEIEPEDAEEAEEEPKAKGKAKGKAEVKPVKGKGRAKDEEEEDPEDDDDPEEDPEEDAEEEPKAKGKTTAKGKADAKAKTTGKGKTEAKGKTKGKADTKKAKQSEEPEDKYGDLEEDQEDKAILDMIDEAEDLVDLAKDMVEQNASLEYQLGGILFHLRRDKAYVGLDKRYAAKAEFGKPSGFELFLAEQLNLEYRKAMYLVDIYYKFSKHGIASEKVKELGWTKASKIAAVMTEDNAEELVELASESSVKELTESIKESYVEVGGSKTAGEKRRKVTFKFRLFEDQASAVEEILTAAAENLSMSLDDTFEHIVTQWAAENGVTVKPSKTTRAFKKDAEEKTSAKPSAKARSK